MPVDTRRRLKDILLHLARDKEPGKPFAALTLERYIADVCGFNPGTVKTYKTQLFRQGFILPVPDRPNFVQLAKNIKELMQDA